MKKRTPSAETVTAYEKSLDPKVSTLNFMERHVVGDEPWYPNGHLLLYSDEEGEDSQHSCGRC